MHTQFGSRFVNLVNLSKEPALNMIDFLFFHLYSMNFSPDFYYLLPSIVPWGSIGERSLRGARQVYGIAKSQPTWKHGERAESFN